MPFRPLPIPYKIGVDICHIPRIRRILLANSYANKDLKNSDTTPTYHKDESTKPYHVPTRTSKAMVHNCQSLGTQAKLSEMGVHLNPFFLNKLFREEEIRQLRELYNRVAGTDAHERLFEYIAGRWAAKEAIIKAASSSYSYPKGHGGDKLGFHDIRIWKPKDSNGEVAAAVLFKRDKEAAFLTRISQSTSLKDGVPANDIILGSQGDGPHEKLDGDMVSISISHDRDYAVATALFC